MPGCVLAVEYPVIFYNFTVQPSSGIVFKPTFNGGDGVISALISQYDFSKFFYSSYNTFSSPFSVSGQGSAQRFYFPTGFNSDEFTIYLDMVCYVSPVNYKLGSLYYSDFYSFPVTPSSINLVVYFSDGTSQTVSFNSSSIDFMLNTPFSFTFKRDRHTHQYMLSSDDFYLSSDDVTAPVNISIGSFSADMAATGVQFFSSGYSTSLRTAYTPSNGGHGPFQVDNRIEVSNEETSGGHFFNMYATKLAFQCLSATLSSETVQFDNVNVNSQANLDSIDIDHGTVDQSLVTLSAVPDEVYISSFTFSFDFVSLVQSTNFDLSKPLPYFVGSSRGTVYSSEYYWFFKTSYQIDTSAGDGSAGYLASILSFLRYDLPLQLRHLIIPSTEEVQDVLTDASDDIKQNAGGLGQAWDMVDIEMNELQQAIGSGSATPVILPKLEFDCFGVEVKLWDDIDFAPYLQSDVVKLLMIPAELMAIYILANNLLRHFYLMYVCLTSGLSYGAFLRYLTSKVD